jgi:hypothetical protein
MLNEQKKKQGRVFDEKKNDLFILNELTIQKQN